jgi:hypothetical protein
MAAPYIYRGQLLEPDPEPTPKARFRFGFSGKRKHPRPQENTIVTSDDILDSLTRQAASQVGLGEQTQSLELIAETEEPTLFSEPATPTVAQFRRETSRRWGNYLIVLMCIGGMIVVWLYSSGRGILDASVLNTIVPTTAVQSMFANPLQVGVMSVIAMLTALWIAVRRRASRLHIQV